MLWISVGDQFRCPTCLGVGENDDAVGSITACARSSCTRGKTACSASASITATGTTDATITCPGRRTATATATARPRYADKETTSRYSTGPNRILASCTAGSTNN